MFYQGDNTYVVVNPTLLPTAGGILTSQASFSKPLAQPGLKSHGRTPSNDFIMSDTSLALLGELSLSSTSSKQRKESGSSTNENKGLNSPANQRKQSEFTSTYKSNIQNTTEDVKSGQLTSQHPSGTPGL